MFCVAIPTFTLNVRRLENLRINGSHLDHYRTPNAVMYAIHFVFSILFEDEAKFPRL